MLRMLICPAALTHITHAPFLYRTTGQLLIAPGSLDLSHLSPRHMLEMPQMLCTTDAAAAATQLHQQAIAAVQAAAT